VYVFIGWGGLVFFFFYKDTLAHWCKLATLEEYKKVSQVMLIFFGSKRRKK
jgi:hypothetical protein